MISKYGNILRKLARAVLFCTKRFPQGFHSGSGIRKLRKLFRKDLFSSQNEDISDGDIGVTQKQIGAALSNRPRSSQNSRREEKQGSQERQNAIHCDPHNPKRQQNQPNKRIQHERKQCERPAKEEQDTPQEESDHGYHLTSYYAGTRFEVPSFAKASSFSLRAIEMGTSASSNM